MSAAPDSRVPPLVPLDCRTAMRQLWRYLDGALDEAEAAAVRAHVEHCAECRPHTDFERDLKRALAATRTEHDDVIRLRLDVLRALHAAGMPVR